MATFKPIKENEKLNQLELKGKEECILIMFRIKSNKGSSSIPLSNNQKSVNVIDPT